MKGSFGLFGTTPSSWKRKEFGLRLLTASRRTPRDGSFQPVTFSIFFFTLSSTLMMLLPRVCRAYRGPGEPAVAMIRANTLARLVGERQFLSVFAKRSST